MTRKYDKKTEKPGGEKAASFFLPREKRRRKTRSIFTLLLLAAVLFSVVVVTVLPNDSVDAADREETIGYFTYILTDDGTNCTAVIKLYSTPTNEAPQVSGTVTSIVDGKVYTVVGVGDGAFGSTIVKTIVLPASITSVGDYAFAGCTSLTSISMPGVLTIGYQSFYLCETLVDVEAPALQTMGSYAFGRTTLLTDLELNAVINIGSYAFENSGLTSIEMNSVKTIGAYAFKITTTSPAGAGLTTVVAPELVTIGTDAFAGSPLENIQIPKVVTIGPTAFARTQIVTLGLPGTLTSISANSLEGCMKLESIVVDPSNTKYLSGSDGVLYERVGAATHLMVCPKAYEGQVVIRSDTASMSNQAFRSAAISSVVINGITTIPDDAFNGCSKLTEVILSSSGMTVGSRAFSGCVQLTNFSSSNVSEFGSLVFEGSAIDYLTLRNGVKVKSDSFAGMSALSSVSLYDSSAGIQMLDGNIDDLFNGSAGLALTVYNSNVATAKVLTSTFDWTVGGATVRSLSIQGNGGYTGSSLSMAVLTSGAPGRSLSFGSAITGTTGGIFRDPSNNLLTGVDRAAIWYEHNPAMPGEWKYHSKVFVITFSVPSTLPNSTPYTDGNPSNLSVRQGGFAILPMLWNPYYKIMWYEDLNNNNTYDSGEEFSPINIQRNYNLKGVWIEKVYLVSVEANPTTGGTVSSSDDNSTWNTTPMGYKYDSDLWIRAVPAAGWGYVGGLPGSVNYDPANYAGYTAVLKTPGTDITYTGNFLKLWKVTFNYNDGTTPNGDYTYYDGQVFNTITPAAPPSRPGLVFDGWYVGNTKYTTETITSNITVTAKWKAVVTFNFNDGITPSTTGSYNEGDVFGTIADPTWSGKTFVGWYDSPDYTTFTTTATKYVSTTPVNGNVTLYAIWKVTVTYDQTGGSPSPAPEDHFVYGDAALSAYNTKFRVPAGTFSKAGGLELKGWFSTSAGGTQYTAATDVLSSFTAYAVWEAGVILNFNDGTTPNTSSSYDEGAMFTQADPVWSGKTFVGWYDSPDYTTFTTTATKYESTTPVNGDVTLYAIWKVTVTYDSTGGSPSPAAEDHFVYGDAALSAYNTKFRVPTGTFTKTGGLELKGWFSTSAGGTQYTAATDVLTSFTAYAVWAIEVTLNFNDGITANSSSYYDEGALFSQANPTWTDRTFVRWSDNPDPAKFGTSDAKYYVSGTTPITEKVTLYAIWEATITFNPNGGTFAPLTFGVEKVYAYGDSTLNGYNKTFGDIRPNAPGSPNPVLNPPGTETLGGWFVGSVKCNDTDVMNKTVTVVAEYGLLVTFDHNNGTSTVTSAIYTLSDMLSVHMPANPSWSDVTGFIGWFTAPGSGGTQYTSTSVVTGPVSLYAHWAATVTYDATPSTDTYVSSTVYVNGNRAHSTSDPLFYSPGTPVLTGQVFMGWFSGAGGTGTQIVDGSAILKDMTAYAKFQAEVTFNVNGGSSGTIPAQYYTSGATFVPPTDPTHTTLTFRGWYDGSTLYNASSTITSSVNLVAKWEAEVTFNVNGGSSGTIPAQYYAAGATFAPPADPTHATMTFRGWYDGSVLYNASSTITSSVNLVAKWEAEVTFNVNGGSSGTIPAQYYTAGATFVPPADPTHATLTFRGWYDGSTLYNASSTITSSVNLVAKWEAEVTFNVNGGSSGTIPAQYYTAGATFAPPANPTKTGLSFAGWYQGAAFSNTPAWFASATQYVGGTTPVNSDVTLYAKWEATITYNLSGADTPASLGPDTVDENSNFVKPVTDPTKAGTSFTSWAEFGTGIVYTPTTVITKSVTLVPLWGVSIIFDPNGGYSTDSSNSSPYNPIVVSNVPSTDTFGMIMPTHPTAKTDLTFAGWYYSAAPFSNTPSWFGGATLANNTDALNTTRTYYAAWTATVTFDPNNSGPTSNSTVNENEELSTIKPADPVNSGLTFVGWYDDVLNIEYTDTSLITGDVTLTAHWGHIVSFSTNGGLPSSLPSIKVTDGTGMGVLCPTDPAKSNLHFAGWWDTTQSPAVLYDSTEPIMGDITLTAKWESYVTLVSGSVPTLVKVEEGTSMGTDLPTLPNTAGLTFDGWYLSPALTAKVESTDIISGDMVLIAKWVAVVSFDLNGGSSAPVSNASYTAGALFIDPGVTVMKGGVAFDGWYDTRFATPVKYIGGSTPVNENVTLYAMWKVTVTFDTKGGAPSVGPLTVSEGTLFNAIKPADPTKAGLVFDGWWNDALSTPVKYTGTEAITASITLTAHWRVTITYVANGGYFTGSTPETVWEGYAFVLPANPTKSGLTFGGWYYNNSVPYVMGDANWFDTATPCLAGTPINEDTALVAKWIATVNVNVNGGSAVTTPVYVDEGKTLGSGYPSPVTKSNLTFKGWYDISVNPFVEYFSGTPITKSVTIVALWEATVTFDSDSGTPSYAPATVAEGAAFGTIMPADPSKSGYVFAGWYDGGVRYTYTTPVTGNTTLTAKWNSIPTAPVVKYAIMAYSDNNSNISPSGMSTVSAGDSVTYNFGAKSGYNLEVYIDGVLRPELSNETSYTFYSIGGSHFIEVRGTLSGEGNRGFLHIDTVGHGSVYYSVNGKDYTLYVSPIPLYGGYDIKLEAVSDSGYYFDSWSGYSSSTASRISVYESGISTFAAGDLFVSANFNKVDDSISFHLWIWILIIIILLILVCILFFLWRREKKERSEYERS